MGKKKKLPKFYQYPGEFNLAISSNGKILPKSGREKKTKLSNTPFKKGNTTQVLSIIFHQSLICICHVRYHWKPCLFDFLLMPDLL